MKRLFAFVIAALLLCNAAIAQKHYSRSDMSADLDSLYATIKEVHPDMFTVISRNEFEAKLGKAKETLKDSATIFDFYSVAATLVTSISDGHTFIPFPWKKLDDINPPLLPFRRIRWDTARSGMVIESDLDPCRDKSLENTKIIGINGRPIANIIDTLIQHMPGESLNFRLCRLAGDLAVQYYLIDKSDKFTIEYEKEGNLDTATVAGITVGQRNKRIKELQSQTSGKNRPFSYSVDQRNNTAVLDFRSFDHEGRIKHFADSMFSDLKERNIGNLIIDIRKNGGGDSGVGDTLLQYISHVPFSQFGGMRHRVSSPFRKYIRRYSDYFDTVPDGLNTYTLPKPDDLPDNPLRYNGKVFLLTSNSTFSSASSFAWAFRHFGMGIMIGEETGGMVFTFGQVTYCTLPNTGLRSGVSCKEFWMYGATEKDRGRGVIPHIIVPEEQAMDKARDIISQNSIR